MFLLKLILAFTATALLSGCVATQVLGLNIQTVSLYQSGQYDQAVVVANKALEVAEKELGSDHLAVAQSLGNAAVVYHAQGQYAKAESLLMRSLAILEKDLGPNHADVALNLSTLAALYQIQGQYAKAEPLFMRSLAIWDKTFMPDHPNLAKILNELADLYYVQGQYSKAEPLYIRSLAIWEKALGPNHRYVAHGLTDLAKLYTAQSQFAKAEPLFIRALTILEKSLELDHPEMADSLRELSGLYFFQGQFAKAEPLVIRALEIKEKFLGLEHSDVALSLSDLSALYFSQGQAAKAEPLIGRALAIYEKTLGPDHPYVGQILLGNSLITWSLNNLAEALIAMQRSITIREYHLGFFLMKGSEEEKRAYMGAIAFDPPMAISLQQAVGSANLAATRLALTTLLQRKGRILDAISADVANLRERLNEQDRALLDQLAAIRNQQSSLSNLALQGKIAPEYHDEKARLEAEAQALEAKISSHSAEFKTKVQPITLAGIQQAVPKDAVLVEFAVYRPFNPKGKKVADQWGAARYIAYVLRPQGEPLSVELGEAAAIDRKISELQKALADPASNSALHLARQLDEQLMRPVRKLLGKTRTVFLSPDGALNLLPFGALVDENNQHLIKHYAFTYLSSGRDLLRQAKVQSQNPGVIIGDVDFGVAGNSIQTAAVDSGAPNRRSSTFVSGKWNPLPGTAIEAREIKKILPAAEVLLGKEATEGALKKLNSPRILHVATHGFFLPDLQETPDDLLKSQSLNGAARIPVTENPLLRSGLVLANANRLESAGEDGVLTALETSGLNLWGTRLVVLSACETGLGDVQNGEGVFGLRRALIISGSESQLMTLWKVHDLATKDLMVDYYRRLVSKEGRSEALRQAQLAMLSDPKRQHPYYWASFIASGDWRPLD